MRWFAALRRSGEIAAVRRRGRRAAATTLAGYALPAASGGVRLAVSVSKSVGGAVVRNRIRRRIRGALEALPPPATALRLLVVANPAAAREPYARLAADVAGVLERLGGGP